MGRPYVIVLAFAAARKATNSWQSIEASVIAEKFQAMVALGSDARSQPESPDKAPALIQGLPRPNGRIDVDTGRDDK